MTFRNFGDQVDERNFTEDKEGGDEEDMDGLQRKSVNSVLEK